MKDSIIVYASTVEASRKLNTEQFVEFWKKYFDYGLNDTPFVTDDVAVDILFTATKPNIDNANNRYKNCVENGKKGGRPKTKENQGNNQEQNQEETKKITKEKPTDNQEETKVEMSDNLNDNDNVNEDDNDTGNCNDYDSGDNTLNEKEDYDVDVTVDSSNQEEEKVEATGKLKLLLESFVDGDNTRFPTMDELRAIFIKENIHFTDEDFKDNSSGVVDGKYKLSPKNATMSVCKYLRNAIKNHGFLYDSDNKDIQNAVISYINKKKLNVVIGNNY